MYNGWNECAKALPFLLKAKELDPEFEGLVVELAFSFNCLKNYDKAIEVLEDEIKRNPSDAYVNKEYIYSVTKTDNIEKATKQFYNSIKTIKENTYNAENCFNIMQFYYKQNDKKNFIKWYDEIKKWPNDNKQINKYTELMKEELK
jgi:tetratricopeptide (TPR) repeat protein